MSTTEIDALPPAGYDPGTMPADIPPDSVAARLRIARGNAGLTQAEAAARMPGSVTVQYWSDVENGRRNPSLEWLWEAAQALGCNPNKLDHRLASVRPKRP